MKAFLALIRREFIEHRGAFLIAPAVLVALGLGVAILAFTVGKADFRASGQLVTFTPSIVFEVGFLGFSFGWALYLIAALFFYCADGFAADKRNNAMLFWKSMPVSDFKVLLSKLVAALTIFPATIYLAALISGALLCAVVLAAALLGGGQGWANVAFDAGLPARVLLSYVNVAGATFLAFALGLLWYMPFMALVGAFGAVVGRWAIPLTLLLPTLISVLQWAIFGGSLHPFISSSWQFFEYRTAFPLVDGYITNWFGSGLPFDFTAFATDLLARVDWMQMGIGAVFSIGVIYLASEYRRRSNDN